VFWCICRFYWGWRCSWQQFQQCWCGKAACGAGPGARSVRRLFSAWHCQASLGRGQCRASSMQCVRLCSSWRCQDAVWLRAVPGQQHAVRAVVQCLAVPGCRMVAGSAGPVACCACCCAMPGGARMRMVAGSAGPVACCAGSCAMPGGARLQYGRGQCRTGSVLCVQSCNAWRCQDAVWSRAVPDQQHAMRALVQCLAVPGCRMVAGSAGPAACRA
jgi:hypothetical protein